ncbi:MAG TPA: methyltransferase domain-containing protein [Pyrinomonadaceae bacterium]
MNQPRLEIDDLAAVIRESMAAHKNNEPRRDAQTVSPETGPPHLKLQPDFQPSADHRYHINDLLRYHDRVFVQAAYRAVLKRSPDETESLRDLKRLRSGDINKTDLLATLRFSPEGRAKGVRLDGLVLPALIRRLGQLPLLGYLIRLSIALVRLPNLIRDQREFGSYLLSQNEQIADFINASSDRLTDQQHTLAQRQGDAWDDLKERIVGSRADAAQELAALRFRIGDLADPELEALYVALEDRFRGTREEIKERFREYLPYLMGQAPVIDLGCGRGEWLELLTENGIEARGVDSNGLQVEQCRARGLDVTEQDLFVYLQSMPDESAGAITGFHIIEHLSFNALMALLNEVMRVLRRGGVAIFETPNPENIVVGSNYFYLDPTHRHPLPTELMEFLFKNRGFEEVKVLPLHPWESGRVEGEGQLAERFNGYFYGPMDYAIVGRKVGP